MMRFSLLLGAMVLLVSVPQSWGGDEVGNGGGAAEHHIAFALLNLEGSIQQCLFSTACKLEIAERSLLERIALQLRQNPPGPEKIEYRSEKEQPGFFILDGQVRLAKTTNAPGAPIFINRDLIYTRGRDQVWNPMSIAAASAMLIHELGHQQGEMDHEKLDVLGVKLEASILSVTQVFSGGLGAENIVITASNATTPKQSQQSTRVLVRDGKTSVDLTAALIAGRRECDSKQVKCEIYFWNLHWEKSGAPVKGSSFVATLSGTSIFKIKLLIDNREIFIRYPEQKLILMEFKKDEGGSIRFSSRPDFFSVKTLPCKTHCFAGIGR